MLRTQAQFEKQFLRRYRKDTQPLGTGADAETPEQATARRETEVEAYADTLIGNEDVQPES